MNTKQITQGAMCSGLYALILLLNLQFGLFIEDSMSWVFSIPILIYTAKYSIKAGVITCFAMAIESFLFGSFTTWFYSWAYLIVGLVFGIGLQKKWNVVAQMGVCIALNCIANALIFTIWAGIFGLDISEDLKMLQSVAPWMKPWAYLVLVIVLLSLMTTVCIYLIAYLICRKLRIPWETKAVYDALYCPYWFALLSIIIFIGFCFMLAKAQAQELSSSILNGCFVIYFLDIIILGFYGAMDVFRYAVRKGSRLLASLSTIVAFIPGLNILWAVVAIVQAFKRKFSKAVA